MKSCKLLLRLVHLACSFAALGQSTGASITGIVNDPSKAAIPEVLVTTINTEWLLPETVLQLLNLLSDFTKLFLQVAVIHRSPPQRQCA